MTGHHWDWPYASLHDRCPLMQGAQFSKCTSHLNIIRYWQLINKVYSNGFVYFMQILQIWINWIKLLKYVYVHACTYRNLAVKITLSLLSRIRCQFWGKETTHNLFCALSFFLRICSEEAISLVPLLQISFMYYDNDYGCTLQHRWQLMQRDCLLEPKTSIGEWLHSSKTTYSHLSMKFCRNGVTGTSLLQN